MIIGNISKSICQVRSIGADYINKVINIIKNTTFSQLDDGIYKINKDKFFYLITTYKTVPYIEEKTAETHRKYIDLQYIIYGEEKVGYADYSNNKVIVEDYNIDKDVELYKKVENESFFIFRKDMYAIFYPEDIHRPGLNNTEIKEVKKVIFKILI